VHDVSLYLLELLENSVRAGAGHINVGLRIDHASDEFLMTVDDDGQGLNAAPEQVLDPFFTTKEGKKTGLGLSLLRAEAEAAGGGLSIGPSPTLGGAQVHVTMRLSHVDRPPLGDLATTLVVTAVTNLDVEFTISLEGDEFGQPLIEAPLAEATDRLLHCAERLA
jgi:hypothetical protein